jgi:integrase
VRSASHSASGAECCAEGRDREGSRAAYAALFVCHGQDIRTAQELLGHSDVKTTMIYTHVLGLGASGVQSPLDGLNDEEDSAAGTAQ